ncbi:MAG: tetratricopeptide repeat protein [Ignavibacteria bacterium]|nr:tetratricopeptide repeat protein [Ignavibacteria bacterium]
MKKLLIPLLSFLFIITAKSQQSSIDSIQVSISTHPDTQQVRELNDLSFNIKSADPDKAGSISLRARELARKLNNIYELGRSYYNEGNAYLFKGNNTQAITRFDSANIYFTLAKNTYYKARVLNSQGIVYRSLGNYSKALAVLFEALAIREKMQDPTGLAATLNNLGAVYQSMNELKQSLTYFQRALDLYKKNADSKNACMTLSNIGAIHAALQNFTQALDCQQEALSLAKQTNDIFSMATIYSNIGADLIELGRISEAIAYHSKGLSIKKQIGDQVGEAATLLNIGQCYYYLKQYSVAERYLLNGLSLAKLSESPEVIKNANLYLSGLYEKTGNYTKALFHFKTCSMIKDSLFDDDKARQIGKIEARYEIEKTQEELQQKQQEEQRIMQEKLNRRNRLQYSGIFIFIIFLAIGAFLSGRLRLPMVIAEGFTFFMFLLLFEFLLLLMEPTVDGISNSIPLIKLACNAALALIISPLHGFLEAKMKKQVLTNKRHANPAGK